MNRGSVSRKLSRAHRASQRTGLPACAEGRGRTGEGSIRTKVRIVQTINSVRSCHPTHLCILESVPSPIKNKKIRLRKEKRKPRLDRAILTATLSVCQIWKHNIFRQLILKSLLSGFFAFRSKQMKGREAAPFSILMYEYLLEKSLTWLVGWFLSKKIRRHQMVKKVGKKASYLLLSRRNFWSNFKNHSTIISTLHYVCSTGR